LCVCVCVCVCVYSNRLVCIHMKSIPLAVSEDMDTVIIIYIYEIFSSPLSPFTNKIWDRQEWLMVGSSGS